MRERNDHKQVLVTGRSTSGKRFRIYCDEKIAGLIRKINEAGIPTMFSCQNLLMEEGKESGAIQVIFSHDVPVKDLQRAMNIIARRYPKRVLFMSQNAYFDPEILVVSESKLAGLNFAFWSRKYDKVTRKAELNANIVMHVSEKV